MIEMSYKILGGKQTFSRKQAALQQIETAIRLFHKSEFACSITLALAAEEQIEKVDAPYLQKIVQERNPDAARKFNDVRNWLKHHKPPEEIDIFPFEVVIALIRATTKFFAAYAEETTAIEEFHQWAQENGFTK